jgi:hypothetical protein
MIKRPGMPAVAGLLLCAAVAVSGCTHRGAPHDMAGHHHAMPTATTKAADLRAALDMLLTEHVTLSVAATGAAIGGRQAEFDAAAAALDDNSVAISQAVGSIYGPEVESDFLMLWRDHIAQLVTYTAAAAAGDQAKRDETAGEMLNYTVDFANFLSVSNPDLPRAAVTDLLKTHVATLKAVVDAQLAGDSAAAFTAQHEAHDHMNAVAVALAETIVQQYPERFQ